MHRAAIERAPGEHRLGLAEDFQALQLFKLTEARLRSKGLAMSEVRRRRRRRRRRCCTHA